jgi:hypothetical protein
MQNLSKDYRRVYPTKYTNASSRGHCIFQITLDHHGKKNKIYIGDLAGVEDVSGNGAGIKGEDFVLKEGLAIRDSVRSFIKSFKQKQRSACFKKQKQPEQPADEIFKYDDPMCKLKDPIGFLRQELFTDEDAKLTIAACFDPATTTTNGNGQSKTDKDKIKRTMQLNAYVLTSLFD